MSADAHAVKQRSTAALRRQRDAVAALSHRIHAHPELGYEEERASSWLCDALATAGYTVEAGTGGLPTAFRAHSGSGPLTIGVLAEYDALPGIGHACGHNVIAAAAYGAALALAPVADDLGLSVVVLGTPAEESLRQGGGKTLLLERGAFEGIDAAMMVHPTPFEAATPPLIAASPVSVSVTGKAAHASAAPHHGRNAADALTVAQVALGLLRQHLPPDTRVSGITTHAGEAANVIPALATADYILRAPTLPELEDLRARVGACFDAGALATGCTVEHSGRARPYADVRHNQPLADAYARNAATLGRTFDPDEDVARFLPSTDAGNVSHVLPLIHPYLGLGSWPVVNHQPEFAALCATPTADEAALAGAAAMAWTAADLATDPALRKAALSAQEVSRA